MREGVSAVARSAPIRLVLLGGCTFFFALGSLVLDQAWLVAERGYTVRDGQLIFGVLILVPGLVGAWVSGWLSDRAARQGLAGRLRFLAWTALAFAVGSAVLRLSSPRSMPFYLGAVLSYVLINAPTGPIMAALAELAPPRMKSTVVAIGMVSVVLFGTSGGNAAVGWLADFLIAHKVRNPLSMALLIDNLTAIAAAFLFYTAARAAIKVNSNADVANRRAA